MKEFFNTLKIDYGKCPPDCSLCAEACINGTKEEAKITPIHLSETGSHGVLACNQCGEPRCLEICPVRAITKSETDGIVRIDEEKCVGCTLCTLACPYGGIHYNLATKKSFKCDHCDGQPRCVEVCPHGVLSYIKNRDIYSYYKCDDRVTPGNALCVGCTAELALRFTLRVVGEDTIFFASPGCATLAMIGVIPDGALSKVPVSLCLLTNTDALMTGVKRHYRSIGRDVRLVAFIGDGATADAGFQSLSGAAERGENIIHICYDNEAYMNTGIQRSSTTPYQGWTTTTAVGKTVQGKQEPGKYMPLIMASHGIPYVATASVAFPEDYAQKLTKAMAVKDGMAYIHLLTPCPTGWLASSNSGIEISMMAVETNYFPLWEAENGKFRFTYSPKEVQPVQEYTKLMGRFSHFKEGDLENFQRTIDDRVALLSHLCSL